LCPLGFDSSLIAVDFRVSLFSFCLFWALVVFGPWGAHAGVLSTLVQGRKGQRVDHGRRGKQQGGWALGTSAWYQAASSAQQLQQASRGGAWAGRAPAACLRVCRISRFGWWSTATTSRIATAGRLGSARQQQSSSAARQQKASSASRQQHAARTAATSAHTRWSGKISSRLLFCICGAVLAVFSLFCKNFL